MTNITIIWFIVGAALMLLEFILPGMVSIFLGASAVLVGIALSLGIISGISHSLIAWFISSIVMVVGLRGLLLKYVPQGDVTVGELNNVLMNSGQIVTVDEEVGLEEGGRIFFHDSTWAAITSEGKIPKGAKAKIVTRIKSVYVVEPLSELDRLES